MLRKRHGQNSDPFERNKVEIAKENAMLLRRVNFCAFINMTAMSVFSPFMSGFSSSVKLYLAAALLTAAFGLFAQRGLARYPRAVLPLFYGLMTALCAYAVALSVYFYPDIHGVTIIGIFVLVPMVILDRTWRINSIFFVVYAIACALTIACKPRAIAVDDCVTSGAFMVFGMLIGAYLRGERLRAIEQHRQLALQRDVDPLTGLPNRRLLFERLGEFDANAASARLRGVIMIDIDNFKDYNDRLGHQAGDKCLQRLSAFFQGFAIETGVSVYRYGGEEFLGLIPDSVTIPPEELARRLVAGAHLTWVHANAVTISVGYACREGEDISSEKLIGMADSALYEAKRQGRDRAVRFSRACEAFPVTDTLRKRK